MSARKASEADRIILMREWLRSEALGSMQDDATTTNKQWLVALEQWIEVRQLRVNVASLGEPEQ